MGIGQTEMLIIFLAVLLLFGAKKLPELARGIGKAMGEFRSAQREFQDEIRRAEYTMKEEERKQLYSAPAPRPQPQTPPPAQPETKNPEETAGNTGAV